MDCHVAIDPKLGVDADHFAASWNETPACRALAEARATAAAATAFPLDLAMAQQGLILLAGAAAGLALDALKDAVKDTLTDYFKHKLSRKPSVKVDAVRQPDGAYLLVVTEGP